MGNTDETAADDDDKTEDTSPGRAQPDDAFRQTMYAVETRCDQMTASIANRDTERVEHAARNAVNMWLAGRAACRRLMERHPAGSPLVSAARDLLEANYMKLLELFAEATKTIDDLRTRRVMCEARDMLLAAIAQSFSEAIAVALRTDDEKQT